LNRGWRFADSTGLSMVLVFGRSSSPVLPGVRAVLDYVRTTAAGCRSPAIQSPRALDRSVEQEIPFLPQPRSEPAHVDMRSACAHATYMSRMVQVRNVPDALHRKLKARAADAGQTLSDYLLAELERLATRPTRDEMLAKLHSRRRVTLKTPAALVIRNERESA
jgi:plasmid stability protein